MVPVTLSLMVNTKGTSTMKLIGGSSCAEVVFTSIPVAAAALVPHSSTSILAL